MTSTMIIEILSNSHLDLFLGGWAIIKVSVFFIFLLLYFILGEFKKRIFHEFFDFPESYEYFKN